MPKFVRNFWIDADIDGRQGMVSGGPRTKDGGMFIKIYQRDQGSIVTACTIQCAVEPDGKLVTYVNGEEVYESER